MSLVGVLSALAVASAQTVQNIAFKPYVPAKQFSAVKKFSAFVLHNEADWQRYWSTALAGGATDSNGQPIPAEPSHVDWKTTELVAIHVGMRPHGPYTLQVDSVTKDKNGYTVTVTEIPPRGMAFMHVTYPFVIIEVPPGVEKANVNVLKAPVAGGAARGRALASPGGG